ECLTVLDFIGQAHKKYNFEAKFRAMIGSSRKSVRGVIEDDFPVLPRGCYIELEKLAKEYVLSNLRQNTIDKTSLIEKVKYFEADTSLKLNLDYFLDYYGISLIELYRSDGTRSFHRLLKWAGILNDDKDVEDAVYKKFSGLLQVNSRRLIEYWISFIQNLSEPKNNSE
ncbi:MAG: NgoFVII family restriction endonuclease, partial [Lachnospiraceae bacterium]|nr:NgoFVII family restriction endonuclease [Lachnospiraceae bacterium]